MFAEEKTEEKLVQSVEKVEEMTLLPGMFFVPQSLQQWTHNRDHREIPFASVGEDDEAENLMSPLFAGDGIRKDRLIVFGGGCECLLFS